MKTIAWFKDIHRTDINLVGGKGANLGEMFNAEIPVPEGFVVTAEAYFAFITQTNIKDKILDRLENLDMEDTKELQKASKEVREIIENTEMPEFIASEIKKAYEKMGTRSVGWLTSKENPYVAIRSSATAEDLPEASFAGQQETYLNIKGPEHVVKHVQKGWGSLFTARAIYYRKKQGFPTEKVGIAMVVQRMVESDVSGVMFTSSPTGDKTELIIEAGYGLGEAVVSGAITPDYYSINKKTIEIKKKKYSKQTRKIVKKGKENKWVKVPVAEQERQKLSDKLIKETAKMGIRIEKHYDFPQDIEFAVENSKVYIVQSRAITTLSLGEKVVEEKKKKLAREKGPILQGLPASPGIGAGEVKIIASAAELDKIQEGDILVTKMTEPDMVPAMQRAAGIVTDEGGLTCHAAIVSRELGVPCIVGTEKATQVLKEGEQVTVDALKGFVYEGLIEEAKEKALAVPTPAAPPSPGKKPVTRAPAPGTPVPFPQVTAGIPRTVTKVKVNVALPMAADRAAQTNADGVGLLRAEHMSTAGGMHPAEYIRQGKNRELVEMVKKGVKTVAEKFPGKPVWYRTFDARTDEFTGLKGGEKEPKEANPMLGWHGIRRALDEPELLKAEFQAIKELREKGITNVGVMLPFVQSIAEIRKTKKIMKETGLKPGKDVEFGVMIETPASVMLIEEFIKEGIDFCSIGSNDLTQLTLGIDRNNEHIQKIFKETHPAVMKEIRHVIKVCKKNGVKSSICGQAGSYPEVVKDLVLYGIDSISANIDAVANIRNVVKDTERRIALEAGRIVLAEKEKEFE